MNLQELLPEDAIIYEIGANTGTDTVQLAKMFPKGFIFAYEPVPDNFGKLVSNCRSLSGEFADIELFNLALGSKIGALEFYPSNQGLSGSILRPLEHLKIYPNVSFLNPIQVFCTKLDYETWRLGHIDFVWMDVQGAELDVISGGFETFTRKVKYLKTEFNKVEMYEGAPNLDTILKALPNYRLVEIIWECDTEGDALLINRELE